MARKSSLTLPDREEIVRRYLAGSTQVELAREFRCRFYLIKAILAEAGITQRQALTANTPIEQRLHDALRAAGVGFTTQKRLVGRYVVDISVHQAPVVIEADGARHRAGTEAQQRDAVRDAAHEAAGYRVFRFTGSEINRDAAACIQQVTDAAGLVPDEAPVYDIRTKFSGEDHPRWVGPHELTCGYCGGTFHGRAKRKFCSHEHFILATVKGKPKSAEHGAKIAEANRRRVQTPEARAKIAAARTGKPTTAGRSPSAETRAKISATLTGRAQSAETRARKAAAHTGKQHSPETRAKIAAAVRAARSSQIKIESDLA